MCTSRNDDWAALREGMVAQLERRGIRDPRVLAAMRKVPRHELVPEDVRERAYDAIPLPIGHGQTISAPYIVGSMTELLGLRGDDRVLEIGTGSGYQTAVLCETAGEVYSVEIVAPLLHQAERNLKRLGYHAQLQVADGSFGWPEAAPFDGCMIAAAAPRVPMALVDQLRVGARLVLPLECDDELWLMRLTRTHGGYESEELYRVRFVPMVGAVQVAPV